MKTVITRHPTFVQYLHERGIIDASAEIITHVDESHPVAGRHVIGVLPLHLAVQCLSVTEVPLDLTIEDCAAMQRGDLTLERIREIAQPPRTFLVQRLWTVRAAVTEGLVGAVDNAAIYTIEEHRAFERAVEELDDVALLTMSELARLEEHWDRPVNDPVRIALRHHLATAPFRPGVASR